MSEAVPRKSFYKIGEVCQITDTQPYVLRFWESEFPQLAPRKSRSGQRLYRQKDVDLVLQIKRLLYQDGFTIAGARKKLGMEGESPLEDLFEPVIEEREVEPDRMAEPPPRASAAPAVASGLVERLEDILKLMDATDRRLHKAKR